MKIYKFWSKYQRTINHIDWVDYFTKEKTYITKTYNFIGGSNLSVTDALIKAKNKAEFIEDKIVNNRYISPIAGKDYEVEIREEIIAEINSENIITRNRYGALILNSENTMFVDIDSKYMKPLYSIHSSWFKRWFGSAKKLSIDETIEQRITILSETKRHEFHTFRVYKTPAGYRVIILGEEFVANSDRVVEILKSFKSDYFYVEMCKKQNCFRARLTPKPKRIKVKKHKVIFPFRNDKENKIHEDWVGNYQKISEQYAACKYLYELGSKMNKNTRAIEYHDKFCKAFSSKPIA